MLFTFGKTKTPLCSFCHSCDKTIKHIFLDFRMHICETTVESFKIPSNE